MRSPTLRAALYTCIPLILGAAPARPGAPEEHETLNLEPAAFEPFGDLDLWDGEELRLLPGLGEDALEGIEQGIAFARAAQVDGIALHPFGRIKSTTVGLDRGIRAVVAPRGVVPASQDSRGRDVILGSAPRAPGGQLRLAYGAGGRRLVLGSFSAPLSGPRARGPLRLPGAVELQGSLQALGYDDAGPLGIAEGALDRNDLSRLEAHLGARFRPGGPGSGLGEIGIHTSSQERHHHVQEFAEDLLHAPKETQAHFLLSTRYGWMAGGTEISARGTFRRDLEETGDGRAFDVFENYNAAGDTRESTEDGLYWRGDDPSTPFDEGHYFDYYRRDLGSALSLSLEAKRAWRSGAPLSLGIERRWTTWRHYENLSPIAAGRGDLQQSLYLGYTEDGDARAEPAGAAARRPGLTSAWGTQAIGSDRAALECGLRVERWRVDQAPLASLDAPLGADESLDPADLAQSRVETWAEPRLGIHLAVGRATHLWLDGGQERNEPPFEALYYAPSFVTHQAYLAGRGSLGDLAGFPNGNPALEPEAQATLHLGVRHTLVGGPGLRASGRITRVTDTWVARAHGAGDDQLLFYENRGERREESLLLELLLPRGASGRLRLRYTLARARTNVIEPAPLYRALLAPQSHAEAPSERESAPLEPIWVDDGQSRGFFPSLLDRRHQLALVYTTRVQSGPLAGALGGSDLCLVVHGASGLPYTPIPLRAEGEVSSLDDAATIAPGAGPMSGRGPWSYQIDAAWAHTFPFWRGTTIELGLEGRNLLNRENAIDVYSATGEADDDGWLSGRNPAAPSDPAERAAYRERVKDPVRFDEGRAIRATLSLQL